MTASCVNSRKRGEGGEYVFNLGRSNLFFFSIFNGNIKKLFLIKILSIIYFSDWDIFKIFCFKN